MIDCFVCLNPVNELRFGMAVASVAQWRRHPVNLKLLVPAPTIRDFHHKGWNNLPYIGVTGEFQVERRRIADQLGSPFYILADDDCLFLGDVEEALDVMKRHPKFAILSAFPTNAKINPWTPEGYRPVSNDEVLEHVSAGGIRFCRQNALETWPTFVGPGYDMAQCSALRKERWRVGLMKNVKMNHLGEGASTIWNTSPPLSSPLALRSSLHSFGRSISVQ